jgi:hypothetical protein
MNTLFLALLAYTFLFLTLHDWVPLGRLNDLPALRSQRSLRARVLASGLMGAFSGWALYLNWSQSPHPSGDTRWYTFILFALFVPGMLRAWWIPYLFGVGLSEEFIANYKVMFGNTITLLPRRHGITVDLLHMTFHLVVLVTLAIAAVRCFG